MMTLLLDSLLLGKPVMGLSAKKRIIFLFCFIFVSVLVFSFTVCVSSTVKEIRYSVQFDHTRIVIDLSRPAVYQIVEFKDPERLAINIKRTKVASDVRPVGMLNGVVEHVRLNKLSWGSQVVLDLREKARWNHFVLDKTGSRPNRIVLDVYPIRSSAQPGQAAEETSNETAASNTSAVPVKRRSSAAASELSEYIVAIDAGHGGMDPGAIGRYGIVEKHLVLDISKQIAREINKYKGYRAVLTRMNDLYLTLPQRTQIAQAKGADLFISLHLNTAKNRNARGAEVFFISPAGAADKVSKLLSDKNRAESELGLNHGHSDEVLSLILDVNQQAMMHRSSLLAEKIVDAMSKKGMPPTRGIKQRSFAVLKTIVMPSVLIEAGFISNKYDAKYLKGKSGQAEVAQAVASGIISYLKQHPPPSTNKRDVIVHRVKKGDTLWKISRLYGSSVASIQQANSLDHSTRLYVGQKLLIMNR
jgi:N-acetylmuramoyl-L-alanine amidase